MGEMTSHQQAPAGGGSLLYAQLAAGMIVFGSATPVSKLVTDAMPVFIGSGLRVAVGALALAPFVSDWSLLRRMSRRDWALVLVIAVFGMFGFSALLLLGMRMISGVYGAVVMATTPAVTAMAAVLFLGERPTWRRIAALALAVGGVLILQVTGAGGGGGVAADRAASDPLTRVIAGLPSSTLLGMAFVFGAVCCEAVYTLVGRRMSRALDPILVAFLAAALSLPLFLPLALLQWPSFDVSATGWQGWVSVLWYGAGTLALGSWLWYAAITRTPGSVAAAFMGLMPVSALVLSYVLLGEPFHPVHLAGFATVFAGVLLMSWEHARMSED